jgi:allophanate hydrolase subunit 2
LSAANGSVAGTIQIDKGDEADTVVVLTADDAETGSFLRTAHAVADGKYAFANLPPGSYKLVAVQESELSIQGNNVLGFEDLMESVAVGAGEKVTKDLQRRMPEAQ